MDRQIKSMVNFTFCFNTMVKSSNIAYQRPLFRLCYFSSNLIIFFQICRPHRRYKRKVVTRRSYLQPTIRDFNPTGKKGTWLEGVMVWNYFQNILKQNAFFSLFCFFHMFASFSIEVWFFYTQIQTYSLKILWNNNLKN